MSRPAPRRRAGLSLPPVSCAAALLLLAAAPAARAEPEALRQARSHFEFGEYAKAVELVEALHDQNLLDEESELIDAWRMHALGSFYLGRLDKARASFLRLLKIDPDYTLDPVLYPPAARSELESVREEHAELLEPIRAERRAIAEARRREREQGQTVIQIERHSFLLNFIPFGVPQIEQGRTRLGAAFAVAQTASLAGTVFTYTKFHLMVGNDGRVQTANYARAVNWRTANWITFGVAAAIYLAGVIDAAAHFEETTITETRRPASAPAQPLLTLSPTEGGAAVVFAGRF